MDNKAGVITANFEGTKKSGSGSSEDTRPGFCGFECLKGHTMCEIVGLGSSNETECGSF